MRKLNKSPIPEVLTKNFESWAQAYATDPANGTHRYRYRHPEIKQALLEETCAKCVYCESKVGHNTPGDIEHKIPSSVAPERHFEWSNLTIACTECNRRKNDYFDALKPFIDPYSDEVETFLVHDGPVISALNGHPVSELSLRILQLHDSSRTLLLSRKIEKIEEINGLCARIVALAGDHLEPVLQADLRRRASASEEYSGMVKQMLERRGWLPA